MFWKEYVTVIISVVAIALSIFNFIASRKKATNLFISLKTLTKSIGDSVQSIEMFFKTTYEFSNTAHRSSTKLSFQGIKGILEKKLGSVYEILKEDTKINKLNKEQILIHLLNIEENLNFLYFLDFEKDDVNQLANEFIRIMVKEYKGIEEIILTS